MIVKVVKVIVTIWELGNNTKTKSDQTGYKQTKSLAMLSKPLYLEVTNKQ